MASQRRKSLRKIRNKNGCVPVDSRNNASELGPDSLVSPAPNPPRLPDSCKLWQVRWMAYASSHAETLPLPLDDPFSVVIIRRLLRAVLSGEFRWRQSAAQVQKEASRRTTLPRPITISRIILKSRFRSSGEGERRGRPVPSKARALFT